MKSETGNLRAETKNGKNSKNYPHVNLDKVDRVASHYEIDRVRRLVMSTLSGVITLPDIRELREKIQKDPDFDPSFAQLVDVAQLSKVELSSEDLRRIAGTNIFAQSSRLAIVATSKFLYGLSRMFQIHREMNGVGGVRVFRDRDEALAWVLGKDGVD